MQNNFKSGARKLGRRFINASGYQRSFTEVARWMLTRKQAPWSRRAINSRIQTQPPIQHPEERMADGIRITLLGHASALIQIAGLNLLTDPVLSQRVGPMMGIGPKRYQAPPFTLTNLPPIDVVLVSHNHYDHLDRPSLRALVQRDDPLILTGLENAKLIPSKRVTECDWWQSQTIDKLRIHYVPAEHGSGRTAFDRDTMLWGSFVIESPHGTVFFAADTGMGDHFVAINQTFGPMEASLLPIGAYEARWFMQPVHMNPAEAVAASLILQSRVNLAIHHQVFHLADEAFDDPVNALHIALEAAREKGQMIDFRAPLFGEAVHI